MKLCWQSWHSSRSSFPPGAGRSGRHLEGARMNPDTGASYRGKVKISRTGDTYSVFWTIDGQEFYGTGLGAKFVGDRFEMGTGQQGRHGDFGRLRVRFLLRHGDVFPAGRRQLAGRVDLWRLAPGGGGELDPLTGPADTPVILVDADACPVKPEILTVAERHGLKVVFVPIAGSGRRATRWSRSSSSRPV